MYIHEESIKLVMAGTGSEDAKKVEQVMIVKIKKIIFLYLSACRVLLILTFFVLILL